MIDDLVIELKKYKERILLEPDKKEILIVQYNRRLYAIYNYIRKLDEDNLNKILEKYFEVVDFEKLNNHLFIKGFMSIHHCLKSLSLSDCFEFLDNFFKINLEKI